MGKIRKVVNWEKLAIPSHSEPLRWEKVGKVANQEKLAIPCHSGLKCHVDLRYLQFVAICTLCFELCTVRFTDSGWLSTAAASGQLC